jgi:hypothetical protein
MDNQFIIPNNLTLQPGRLVRMTATPGNCFHCGAMTNESCSGQTISKWFHKECLIQYRINNNHDEDESD